MTKKIKKEELKNVSGGYGGKDNKINSQRTQTYYCPDCKKTYTSSEVIFKRRDDDHWGEIKCPDCGKVIGEFEQDC